MIEWIVGFLVAKWWMEKDEKKKKEHRQEFAGNIEVTVPFGYVRDGESVQDLQ